MKHLEGYGDIKVLGARVIIKIENEDTTKSGIILTNPDADPKFEGKVVATGTGARNNQGMLMPMDVEPGDHVIYSRMAGVPLKHKDEDLLVINERDVIAIIGESHE